MNNIDGTTAVVGIILFLLALTLILLAFRFSSKIAMYLKSRPPRGRGKIATDKANPAPTGRTTTGAGSSEVISTDPALSKSGKPAAGPDDQDRYEPPVASETPETAETPRSLDEALEESPVAGRTAAASPAGAQARASAGTRISDEPPIAGETPETADVPKSVEQAVAAREVAGETAELNRRTGADTPEVEPSAAGARRESREIPAESDLTATSQAGQTEQAADTQLKKEISGRKAPGRKKSRKK